MTSAMTTSAVIVAAGSSVRMGFDKLAVLLDGVPVLRRTVEAFAACPEIGSVVVVCPQERFDELLGGVEYAKPVIRVNGGCQRQESVARGVAAVPEGTQWVAVHDGARPLIRPDEIRACCEAAREFGAAVLARPVTETLKRVDADGFSAGSVEREGLWFMETPQVFRRDLLQRGLEEVAARHLVVTDEVSAVEAAGVAVRMVPSRHPNLKITTPADLVLAAALGS